MPVTQRDMLDHDHDKICHHTLAYFWPTKHHYFKALITFERKLTYIFLLRGVRSIFSVSLSSLCPLSIEISAKTKYAANLLRILDSPCPYRHRMRERGGYQLSSAAASTQICAASKSCVCSIAFDFLNRK